MPPAFTNFCQLHIQCWNILCRVGSSVAKWFQDFCTISKAVQLLLFFIAQNLFTCLDKSWLDNRPLLFHCPVPLQSSCQHTPCNMLPCFISSLSVRCDISTLLHLLGQGWWCPPFLSLIWSWSVLHSAPRFMHASRYLLYISLSHNSETNAGPSFCLRILPGMALNFFLGEPCCILLHHW